MKENFESAIKAMEPSEAVELFFGNESVSGLFKDNLAYVRDYIEDIVSGNINFNKRISKNSQYKEINFYLNKNTSKCVELYRYYSVFAEIIRYSENKKYNLGVTEIDVAETLREIALKSNEVLKRTDINVIAEEDYSGEFIMLVNKDRFVNFVLMIFQSCFSQYKSIGGIEIRLEQNVCDGFDMIIEIDVSDAVPPSMNREIRVCNLAIEFFLKNYNCKFTDEIDGNIKIYTLSYKRDIMPKYINLEVASPNEALEKILFDDPFSNYHVALSGVAEYDFFDL